MIGNEFPAGLLVRNAADLHGDAIDRAIVGPPHGSENKGIGIGWFQFLGRSRNGGGQDVRAQSSEKESKQQEERGQARKQNHGLKSTSRHRLRFPLPRLLPHSRPRPPSTPADRWSPLRSRCHT